MKRPDEIKKGLECCMDYQNCTEGEDPQCPYYDAQRCMEALLADALALIQQLEADNAQLNRCIENMTDKLNAANDEVAKLQAERDAAVSDLKGYILRPRKVCSLCKNRNKPICNMCEGCDVFEWRGVQKEE